MGFINFPKCTGPTINVIVQLEFKLNSNVKHINHYTISEVKMINILPIFVIWNYWSEGSTKWRFFSTFIRSFIYYSYVIPSAFTSMIVLNFVFK